MPKPKDASFAIIVHDKKVLLFLRDNSPGIPDPNCWSLPGGGLEDKETPLEGLTRELFEEVSYSPKTIIPLGIYKKQNGQKGYLYVSFVKDTEAVKFKHGGNEGVAIKFFAFDELKDLPLTRRLKDYAKFEVLRDVLEKKRVPKAEEIGLIPF